MLQVSDKSFIDKSSVVGLRKNVDHPTVVEVQLIESRQNVNLIVALINGRFIFHKFIAFLFSCRSRWEEERHGRKSGLRIRRS